MTVANPGYNFPRTPKTPKTPLTRLAKIMSFPDDEEEAEEESRSHSGAASECLHLCVCMNVFTGDR